MERALGHFYKQVVMWRSSPADLAWVFVYPFVGLVSLGFFVYFLVGSGAPMESFMFIFAGVIVWNFYDISQRAVTYGITYEMWSDSLKHFFSTTSTEKDYVLGNSAFGFLSSLLALVLVGGIGYFMFGFNIFLAGAYLLLACFSVFLFATAVGLIIDYFIITKGSKYMSLIWISTGIIMIFSGVYYPVGVLPEPVKSISYLLPSTHAIQSIRSSIVSDFSTANITIALSFMLSAIYMAAGSLTPIIAPCIG